MRIQAFLQTCSLWLWGGAWRLHIHTGPLVICWGSGSPSLKDTLHTTLMKEHQAGTPRTSGRQGQEVCSQNKRTWIPEGSPGVRVKG